MPYTIRTMRALVLLRLAAAALIATASLGCKSAPPPTPPATNSTAPEQPEAAASEASRAKATTFDFYLLTLSWSPEYCLTNPSSPECAAHPGFVVHGMWPQDNNGTYPENCSKAPGPANPSSYLDVLPTLALIQHEWLTHGTCSGLAPDAYFSSIRTAFHSVKIPAAYQSDHTQTSLAPAAILSQFASANPTFPKAGFALTCSSNALTAVQVCLTKSLTAEVCQHVSSCTAKTVKIPPQ